MGSMPFKWETLEGGENANVTTEGASIPQPMLIKNTDSVVTSPLRRICMQVTSK